MEELLQAPTEGVGDAIVVSAVLANKFELKVGLLNLVTAISFHGFANDDPHSHIRRFSPLHQIDTFYNGLNQSDQDSLNSAAGGNLLTRNTQEALTMIENKSKVRTSRNKPQVSSSIGSSSKNDAITALTKQVEALGKHIAAMQKSVHSIQESLPDLEVHIIIPSVKPPVASLKGTFMLLWETTIREITLTNLKETVIS
ncbi:hypothetical protein Tco_0261462 [Tanacetum coccineum]